MNESPNQYEDSYLTWLRLCKYIQNNCELEGQYGCKYDENIVLRIAISWSYRCRHTGKKEGGREGIILEIMGLEGVKRTNSDEKKSKETPEDE